jgi:hypothetical protein
MTGKMSGINSLSTSAAVNPICKARAADPTSVCSKCYAMASLKRFSGLRDHTARNFEILNAGLIPADEIPVINSGIFRLEAFGDLGSAVHAANYLQIAALNPWCTFALWTKNPGFLDAAIKKYGKPANLICILSSDKLNTVTDSYKRYDWADHVFTVYTKDAMEDFNINCGSRDCLHCRRCYTVGNTEFFINERLK